VPRTNVSGLTISIALRSTGTSDKAGLRTGGHVAGPDATTHFSLQDTRLLPERGIFGFKSALGLDERRQQVEGKDGQHHHYHQFNADEVFGTHRIAALKFGPDKRRLATTDNWLETVRWLTLSTIKS
jgi:hypothetical protein